MKIKYEFADGTISEVEVDEKFGKVVEESRREEENFERKERYHCGISLESLEYEGKVYEDMTYAPENILEQKESQKRIDMFFSKLTEVQQRRLNMLMDGMTVADVAREEKVDESTIRECLDAIRKKFFKFF